MTLGSIKQKEQQQEEPSADEQAPQRREDIEQIFLSDTPLLDVRAEIEFDKGAFPGATNVPILNTQEREQVGICYKQRGQASAIDLGASLVSGEVRDGRTAAWLQFAKANPMGRLYCFRGGMRSQIAEQWMRDGGSDFNLIPGGYKAMRQFLISEIDSAAQERNMVIVSGRTGTGKTRVINQFANSVDIEGLAQHRGSAFGKRVSGQPTQINFENALGIRLLKLRDALSQAHLIIEDEGRQLGCLNVPLAFHRAMVKSPIVVVDSSYEERIQVVLEEYIIQALDEHIDQFGEDGSQRFSDNLRVSLQNISKRLGGERYQKLSGLLETAMAQFEKDQNPTPFEPVVAHLLKEYYDPMYDYQLSKKADNIVHRGDRSEVVEWLEANT